MSRTYETRRLTVNVPNPTFDGRRRYGIHAVKTFEAGTLIQHSPAVVNKEDPIESLPAVVYYKDNSVPYDMVKVLLDNSEVVQPSNMEEVLMSHDMKDEWWMKDIMQKLLDTGVITIEQFSAACKAVRED